MFVVDTGVALKWYLKEADSEPARHLMRHGLLTPDLLVVELANALRKKVRRGELAHEQAHAAIANAIDILEIVPSIGMIGPVLSIALELDHPAYDCAFLALAEQSDIQLVTADARLLRRCEGTRFAQFLTPLLSA